MAEKAGYKNPSRYSEAKARIDKVLEQLGPSKRFNESKVYSMAKRNYQAASDLHPGIADIAAAGKMFSYAKNELGKSEIGRSINNLNSAVSMFYSTYHRNSKTDPKTAQIARNGIITVSKYVSNHLTQLEGQGEGNKEEGD